MIDSKALQELRDIFGETASDVLAEIIDSYLETAPKLIETIRTALSCGDAAALRQAAHTLKSSSATLGAMKLSHLCAELEIMGRVGTTENSVERILQLEVEYETVKTALQTERQR